MAEKDLKYFELVELLDTCVKSKAKAKTLTEYELEQLIGHCLKLANDIEYKLTNQSLYVKRDGVIVGPKWIEDGKQNLYVHGYNYKTYLKIAEALKKMQAEKNKPSIESIDNEPDKLNLKADHEKILKLVYMHKGDKQQRDLFLRNWIALGDLDKEDSIGKVNHLIGQIKDQNPDINKSDNQCRDWIKLYWSHKNPLQE